MNDNQTRLADCLWVDWQSGHRSPTLKDWKFRWQRIAVTIGGMELALIYFNEHAYLELKDDIRFLHKVALQLYADGK